MSNLNPQQQEAVLTIDGPLLINAGAGSGKTHTITERVVHMIEDRNIDPRSIFCVTFTNKAAREMRERIGKRLGVDMNGVNPFRNNRLPTIGTFHSVASFFLRMFIDKIGYSKDFVIYDSDDCTRLTKEIMKRQNIDDKEFNPRAIHSMISGAKGKGLTPNEYSATVDSYAKSVVLEVYKEYAARLKADNALDFDDLLLLFRQILDIDEVVEYFHNRFRYFMVDEYQDTNLLQYEMIRILASNTRNLCVVGDDWQGIYSWRGADIENILSFKKDYPEAKVINLEENYRSTQMIIDAANAVIKNNTNQMKKTLFTKNPVGEKITMLDGLDEKHETELIASQIQNSKFKIQNGENGTEDKSGIKYGDWAILYRTNGQSRLIEESLIRKNIPYRVFGGVKFYERKEIKDILAYMRLIFNPGDSMSMKRIINVPSRKIGEKSLENFLEVLSREHLTLDEFAENDFLLNSLTGIGAKGIQGFCLTYKTLRELAKTGSVAEVMESLIKRTNYLDYLKEEYTEEEYEGKVENVEEFLNMASRYDGMLFPENLATFLEDIALITDQDRDNENSQDMVSLMTVHLAKGLEFPHVVIAGAEEGVFPHSRSLLEASAIEEERRLMYVAITRAKETLYISRAHERYNFGNYSANPKSRFVKEIPAEYIHVEENRGSAKSIFGGGSEGFSTFGSAFGSSLGGTLGTPKPGISPVQKSGKKNNASDFAVGNRIKHPQYGIGTIVSLKEAIADIAFSGTGIKKMNIEIAPIEKL
ncbi:MAG: UvrD-helicase domain-containing protein [Candidatus Gracilibacteria bacterium]|nr:UvrD-helicase domain-containing protein [Candidatus Gracilibacteria bacterium]